MRSGLYYRGAVLQRGGITEEWYYRGEVLQRDGITEGRYYRGAVLQGAVLQTKLYIKVPI